MEKALDEQLKTKNEQLEKLDKKCPSTSASVTSNESVDDNATAPSPSEDPNKTNFEQYFKTAIPIIETASLEAIAAKYQTYKSELENHYKKFEETAKVLKNAEFDKELRESKRKDEDILRAYQKNQADRTRTLMRSIRTRILAAWTLETLKAEFAKREKDLNDKFIKDMEANQTPAQEKALVDTLNSSKKMNQAWYDSELSRLTNISTPSAITKPVSNGSSMTEAQCTAERESIENNFQTANDEIQKKFGALLSEASSTNSGSSSSSSEQESESSETEKSKKDQIKELEEWKAEKLALIKENEAKATAAISTNLE